MRRLLAGVAIAVAVVGATVAGGATAHAADPPTGGELSAVVASCTQQVSAGLYAERSGGSRTIPVCATGNAVHWRSGMTIDCDGQRTEHCNASTDPYWQNSTAWAQSDGKPLNAEKLPYIVVPGITSTWSYARSGITGGTVAAVVYQGRVAYAVVGDVGPGGAIGEGSYALAKALGINPSPSSGGVSGKVVDYILFPGVKASPIENGADAVAKGQRAAADLVAGRRGCTGVQLDFTSYPPLGSGATGALVQAAQCLLRAAGQDIGDGDPSGTLDEATAEAVRQFQTRVGLPASGSVDAHTWTALLSRGATPQIQDGASGEAVFRVQRALNAAVGAGLAMDGQFGPKTTAAVTQYQSTRGLDADGIVGPNTWSALQTGK
ncbi:peptidoglycan-binding protein [Goodfellowiella coeruleoviolacea]|uniref:Peptidoglycan-binding (PGRP) domain of peptidoglycan hydrolases-containing protein n=1 Tax=Goodfellowiella coeruleoviolacea TaxID=334858 RepID=A0AAE3GFL7_9PSEU|nr:peptidoglycan-binding protein [Goodfellowiella coeruleoviolacea]MCP2167357.1 Peptidoglycan-binding (PGRP) domain of peptidoglycan hydrolases-containing protein [Goodfellowiella coeruleoviolacea]